MTKKKTGQLKITQIRSIIDRPRNQKLTIEALGLGRPNWIKVHNDTPQIRGMINKVKHLVNVEEFDAPAVTKTRSRKKTETAEEEN